MKEHFKIDRNTGEPFVIAETEGCLGGVEGVDLVDVTEEEFADAVAKRDHPLHKDRPKKKDNQGKKKP